MGFSFVLNIQPGYDVIVLSGQKLRPIGSSTGGKPEDHHLSDPQDPPVTAGDLEQAAAWFARLDGDGMSPQEHKAFEGWIAADAAHRKAFDKVSRTWERFADLEGSKGRRTHPGQGPGGRSFVRRMTLGAVAAGLLLIIGVGAGLPMQIEATLRADAVTAVGETRKVALPDGSSVHLNTQSAIAVDYEPGEHGPRHVRLLMGEATFDVVPNPDRPFVVMSGGGTSRVLGTVFTVKALDRDVSVTLHEGRVGVSAGGGPETVLSPNQRVSYRPGGIMDKVEQVNPQAASAWRRGKLVFQDRPLGGVIAELNRYHRGIIRLAGENLRARRVNGVFDTNDPVAVVGALEAALGLRSTRLTDYLILLHE